MTTKSLLLEEAYSAISNINEKIYEQFDNIPHRYSLALSLVSDGHSLAIECFGETLWMDSEDDRPFNEETNEYEPLESFIKNIMKEMLNNLQKVEL